jgi:hypothetical protein
MTSVTMSPSNRNSEWPDIVSAGLDGLRLAETIITGTPARRES